MKVAMMVAAATVLGCGGGGGSNSSGGGAGAHEPTGHRSELAIFMRKKLNPPFSKMSYLLFEDHESDDAALAKAANDLDGVCAELTAFPVPPGDSPQARQVFYEYAAAMRADATKVSSALASGNRDAAAAGFAELRKKCDSCHHFFRYGE